MSKLSLQAILCGLLFLATPSHGNQVLQSNLADQEAVEVTVYNNNLGLIKDVRTTVLPAGEGELRFMDVAAHIQPATVHVSPVDPASGFLVLEQNYEYDLMNAEKLLDKYVGREIKIVDWNDFQDRKDTVEATLLSNNQGQVYRIGGEIYLGHPGIKVLPALPGNLISKPTLTWLFRTEKAGEQKIRVSYLTGNIQWRADYILLLDEDDAGADLSAWVTVDNRSGALYQNARLKLVAGEVHRAEPELGTDKLALGRAMATPQAEEFREEAFFEYHIYDLERPTTLKDQQTKQIRLLEAPGISVEKELLVTGSKWYYARKFRDLRKKEPVNVTISFRNEKENKLGIPLPAGIIRLYKQDSRGSQQFIGEDRIEHTPRDETVRLKTGEAFDVVAERVQTDYRQITTALHETSWEVTLRNHKEEPVAVSILEPLAGNWKILESSHAYTKTDAFHVRFEVEVPADGAAKVEYTVRVGL